MFFSQIETFVPRSVLHPQIILSRFSATSNLKPGVVCFVDQPVLSLLLSWHGVRVSHSFSPFSPSLLSLFFSAPLSLSMRIITKVYLYVNRRVVNRLLLDCTGRSKWPILCQDSLSLSLSVTLKLFTWLGSEKFCEKQIEVVINTIYDSSN